MLLFFSCLQPVQHQVEPSVAEVACTQSCAIQNDVCTQERDCSSQCTTLVQQLSLGDCLAIAEELWSCQQEVSWICSQGLPEQEDPTLCQEEEERYLTCFIPEDTGSNN